MWGGLRVSCRLGFGGFPGVWGDVVDECAVDECAVDECAVPFLFVITAFINTHQHT